MAEHYGYGDGADLILAAITMLGARSGGETTSDPAGHDEMGAAVVAAQAELDRAIQLGGLQSDPLRHPLHALSVHLGTLHKMLLVAGAQIERARQPIREDELRRAVIQGVAAHARDAVRAMNWRNVLIGSGLLAAALLIGAGGGYWFGYRTGVTSVTPFTAMATTEALAWSRLIADNSGNAAASLEVCESAISKADNGRRVCNLPVWLDPPISAR